RWHIFAPDLRGHGKSSHVARGYRGIEYSGDIVGFLKERVPAPAVLFGHSHGGMIGMWVAAHHPELVKALILGDNLISTDGFDQSMYPALFAGLRDLAGNGGSVEEIARGLAKIKLK